MKKYSIETILLYLQNGLVEEMSQEISNYFMENPDELQDVLNIIKLDAYQQPTKNTITFETITQNIQQKCTGIVEFIKNEQLAFRGMVQSYQYTFVDLTLNFLWEQTNVCNLNLSSNKKNLYCELYSRDLQYIFKNEIIKSELFTLEVPQEYYLHVPSYEENALLKVLV